MDIRRVKRRGKYYIYSFKSDGKIDEIAKWSPNYTLKDAIKRRKDADLNSIRKDTIRTKLSKVVEKQRLGKLSRAKPRNRRYQVVAILRKGKIRIEARSMAHDPSYPVRKAKEEAVESVYERYAQASGLEYDAKAGKKKAAMDGAQIETRIVYYVPR